MKDYKRNNALYNRLLDAARHDKLPILDNKTFESMNAEYGKEEMRRNLADYIATERPVFPLTEISYDDMRDNFYNLQKFDTSTICIPKEQVDKEVFEKYDDYEYSYNKYGLGLINGPSTYNDVSNYFMQDLRLECSSYGFRAPKEVWENGDAYDIWKCLGPIWRGINGVKLSKIKDLDGNESEQLLGGELNDKSYISAFRLGTYIATQFKPVVAKAIYQMTNAKRVLDTSCGWGDRLAGFYTSKAESYTGCDPNPETFKNYIKQVIDYESFLGNFKPDITIKEDYFSCNGVKQVKIYRCGAENLPWHDIKNIDCVFTSPPYFSTEHYNKGGLHEEDQSWFKFDTSDKWLNDFFLPVSENSFNSLSDNGHLLLNIIDPTIKGKRYKVCDVLVDTLYKYFNGTMGMTMSQRPDSRTDEQRENSKTKLNKKLGLFDRQKQLKSHYIENIWCFSKNKYDYFSLYKEEKDIQKDLF